MGLTIASLPTLRLNPFEFRASFDPCILEFGRDAVHGVLIPLNSGLHLI